MIYGPHSFLLLFQYLSFKKLLLNIQKLMISSSSATNALQALELELEHHKLNAL